MNIVLDSLHFGWLMMLLSVFTMGWGALIVRSLKLHRSLTVLVGFAAFAAGAHIAFFAYLLGPSSGKAVGSIWGGVSIMIFGAQVRNPDGNRLLRDREAWLPGLLLIILSATYLSLVLAGKQQPYSRFPWEGLKEMPIDDRLPLIFASRLWTGESPTPLLGGGAGTDPWLSSDRPPLQTALELALRPWHLRDRELNNYYCLGTVLQCFWVPAVYSLSRVTGLIVYQIRFILASCAASGFFMINTVFVWPKFLASAFMLTAIAIIFDAVQNQNSIRGKTIIASGCASLAFLSHGGVAFSILALPTLPAAWIFLKRTRLAGLVLAITTFAALYLPWFAYQKFYDPPGNRLLKWHLAGVEKIDSRSFGVTIKKSYSERSLDEALDTWTANLSAVFKLPDISMKNLRGSLRNAQFQSHSSTLGVLALGWLTLVLRSMVFRKFEPEFFQSLLPFVLGSLAFWILIVFVPGGTIIHQGSYCTTVLVIMVGSAGLACWPKIAGAIALIVHAFAFWWIWVLSSPGMLTLKLSPLIMSAFYLGSATFAALLLLIPKKPVN
jgi:hypothetical protein